MAVDYERLAKELGAIHQSHHSMPIKPTSCSDVEVEESIIERQATANTIIHNDNDGNNSNNKKSDSDNKVTNSTTKKSQRRRKGKKSQKKFTNVLANIPA